MNNQEFFPQRTNDKPIIYAFELLDAPSHNGYIKVGYTTRTAEDRIKEITHTIGFKSRILLTESAMRNNGTCFLDYDVHNVLLRNGFKQLNQGKDRNEWYKCSIEDVKNAILQVKTGKDFERNRTRSFTLRPEQEKAINKTIAYYNSAKKEFPTQAPKFLWNAKMRFGKTFAAYQLAKKMGFKKVLILTFKPAVEAAWAEDLLTHIDFEGWQFLSNKNAKYSKQDFDRLYEKADKTKPIVCFGSFQDMLGTTQDGMIKPKNEWIHSTHWDLVIFDEYHFGAWRDNAKKLFSKSNEDEDIDVDYEKYKQEEADDALNETFLHITTDYYLYLSGTPFRALNKGEFIEEEIFSWTYPDEQKAKLNWPDNKTNPYLALPRMVLMTYKIPEEIRQIAEKGEFDQFDLNEFFSAKGKEEQARFKYENEVQKWLDLIRGAYLPSSIDEMKLGGAANRPPMPFSDTRLLNVLNHTLWFLPDIAACYAMANLLRQKQNLFFHDYKINVCAGTQAGIGIEALAPVEASMEDPLKSKTITLSCGKLTTGVTIRPWTGVFMLRNLKSPETYFQTAFRVQSPWEIPVLQTKDGNEIVSPQIMKHECYVFDFALERALSQISEYSCGLQIEETNPEKKVSDFIEFLPVLAYDGAKMVQINAQDVLDIARLGTSATLLAKRWQSAFLVNVNNDTLKRIMENPEAMAALNKIEGFRSINLNDDIAMIINKSEAVKKIKKDGTENLTPKEKKQLTEEEKEYKSKRKQIQDKLIKFATRIPIFMYLTDKREFCLKDVITQLEPQLFKKVTGLEVKDFELLCSLGVFNSNVMNDSIYKFKRYEDDSLSYTGIDKHEGENIGGWDSSITNEEYKRLFFNQQESLDITFKSENKKILKEETDRKTKTAEPRLVTQSFGIKSPIPQEKAEPKENIKEQALSAKVGDIVYHNTFGTGQIIRIYVDKMKVVFKEGTKTLSYQSSFEKGFLKLK